MHHCYYFVMCIEFFCCNSSNMAGMPGFNDELVTLNNCDMNAVTLDDVSLPAPAIKSVFLRRKSNLSHSISPEKDTDTRPSTVVWLSCGFHCY